MATSTDAEVGLPADRVAYNPLDPAQMENPYPVLAAARHDAPVFFSPLFDSWMVTRYDDIVMVLKDPVRFSSADLLKPKIPLPPEVTAVLDQGMIEARGMFNSDPPDHTRLRNLISKAFTPQRIQQLEPRLRILAAEYVDSFIQDGQADVMHQFAFPLTGTLIAEMLGVPRADMAILKPWSDDWMAVQAGMLPLEQLVEAAYNCLKIQQYFINLVEERRSSPGDDLISALLQVQTDGEVPLSTEELATLPLHFLMAGHESTSNLIGNVVKLLLTHPAALQAVRNDVRVLPKVIEEVLRLDTPIPLQSRTTTTEVEINGVRIPKGARLALSAASANHDECQFADPTRFDMHRPQVEKHLSFGKGIHFCIGAALARAETRIAVEALLRLPNLRLRSEHPLERLPSVLMRGYAHMYVEWDIA